MIKVIWVVLVILAILVPSYARAAEPGALAPLILPGTRLMIFSPHPDDETLGAAGLIQTRSPGGREGEGGLYDQRSRLP